MISFLTELRSDNEEQTTTKSKAGRPRKYPNIAIRAYKPSVISKVDVLKPNEDFKQGTLKLIEVSFK